MILWMKIVTILEGRVAPERQEDFKKAYESIIAVTDGIVPESSYLIQNKKEPEIWQIISVWESQELLEQMRASGEVPAGVRIFKEAGAEPELLIFEVQGEK